MNNNNSNNKNKQNSPFIPAHKISDYIRMAWQKSHQHYLQEQRMTQLKLLQVRIFDMMLAMATELFECFHLQNYTGLAPITNPRSIRIFTYRKNNGTFIFKFRLAKSIRDTIAAVQLQNMMQNMNADIASTQAYLAYLYGYQYLSMNYPYLFYGIWITAIQELGDSDIIISVMTYIQP